MKELKEIKHIRVKKGMKVSELVGQMQNTGFGAAKIGEASGIMRKMFSDKENGNCKIFLGVAGAMVPGGMKQIIIDMLEKVDVFVTTGANLTHDLIEALGEKHFKGDEKADDAELNKKEIDRIYNVFMKNEVYKKLEDFFDKHYAELKDIKSIKEFLWKLGELIPEGKESILIKCWQKKIPVFCPGIADSGIGLMMWGREASGKGKSEIRAFSDLNEIIDIAWTSKKNGVIYIGGGLPKNFIQQALQFSKGADYGVQITGDRQELGGSSGAPLREGISWGKMDKDAEFVDVYCDATIALPLVFANI